MLLAFKPAPPLLSAALPLKMAGTVAARKLLAAGAVTEAVVGGVQSLIDCDSAEDVLVVKLPSPPYTAVIEWGDPLRESVVVLKVATPEPFSVPVPSVVAPSLKVTVPVGVPVEEGELSVTVAVNVTDAPEQDGLADEATDVDVVALFTVSVPFA